MTGALFVRSQHNPMIAASDLPYQANAVFNAGAADLGDEVVLLLRVESCSGRSHLIVARSKDGIRDWRVEGRALLHPGEAAHGGTPFVSARVHLPSKRTPAGS